jgi:hypothetical protein
MSSSSNPFDPTQQLATTNPAESPAAPRPTPVRTIAPNVEQTDFTDESVKKYEFELYSGTANTTDRIYIPNTSGVVKARTHYVERGQTKFSLVCRSQYVRRPDGSGEDLVQEAQCCKLLGSSAPRWAVLIIQYATDRTGQPTRPFTLFRKLWRFGSDKYQMIRNIGRDFPLEQHDLSIFCQPDGEQYQKLQIGAKPDCYVMHPNFPEAERKSIQEWAKANVSKLARELGRTYATEAEMMRDLQLAGVLTAPGPTPLMVADQPVANFEDVIQGSAIVQK